MADEYLPLEKAAEYLGVSRPKLNRLVRDGALSYVTSPLDKRKKLFRRSDLEELKRPRPMEGSDTQQAA